MPGDSPGPLQAPRLTALLTLPDYLRPGLKLVFIGLNPGLYSARAGKYFARPTNRFWSALSASEVVGTNLVAGDESLLFGKGMGFTDVVKRATGQVSEVTREEIAAGVAALRGKLGECSPAVACFVGLTGYRWVFGIPVKTPVQPGLQKEAIGSVRVCVLPSTSPANARFSFNDIVEAFRQLKSSLEDLRIRF